MTDRPRALVVCPGRGSYARDTLGYLAHRSLPAQEVINACDTWRDQHARTPVSALDGLGTFSSVKHQAGENASLLTFACTMADWHELSDRYEVVGVTGNSMGFYTALAVSGALPLRDAIRLIDTMGSYQEGNLAGGQVIYPITGADWVPDPVRRKYAVDALHAARAAGGGAWLSIRLGSFVVLGADLAGLKVLLETLPPETRGSRTFPVRLPKHSAFHTPMMQATSDRAFANLGDLGFRAPRLPLVDGTGKVWRPLWADPAKLAHYTMGPQVTEFYDFTAGVATSLYHLAPDVVILLGPGNSLGGPVASTLVAHDWFGFGTREAFEAGQAQTPRILSFAIPSQRDVLVD